jgi:hypothetical protein
MSAEKHLNPSDFSDEQVERLAFTIAGILSKHGVWHEKPLSPKGAMAFLGVGRKKFYSMVNQGIIKENRPDPNGHAFYYPSEMNEGIKKRNQRS